MLSLRVRATKSPIKEETWTVFVCVCVNFWANDVRNLLVSAVNLLVSAARSTGTSTSRRKKLEHTDMSSFFFFGMQDHVSRSHITGANVEVGVKGYAD